jgi:hypothetical protein
MKIVWSDKVHREIFLTKYDRFVDHNLKRTNLDLYIKKMNFVGNLVKDINFERNLLILLDKDCVMETFLSGFMILDTLRSFHLMNIRELYDIFLGNIGENRPNSRPDEYILNTELDIINDVLCVSINNFEHRFAKQGDSMINSLIHTIMRRYEYVEKDPNKPLKLSWVFCKGTQKDLDDTYSKLYEFFDFKKENPMFKIIDLNLRLKNPSQKASKDLKIDSVIDSMDIGECL